MSTTAPASRVPAGHDDLAALGRRLDGAFARPGEPGYELAVPFNVAVPVAPLAVVVAAHAGDVAEAVRFAGDHGLRVAVQRTGHGAVPGADAGDVLLVHTGALDGVEVDAAARTARVGAGALWQDVMDAAAPHGLAPLVGSAPGVGVAGFLTGGGIGPLVRTYGISSDRVRSFEVVTGDGRHRHVSAEDEPDLFWGLRGGKSTLGIVVGVEVELLELTDLHGGALYFDGADAAELLHLWRRWADDLPEHASTSLALLQLPAMPGVPPPLAGRLTVAVRFASVADDATCAALLAPLRAVAEPIVDLVGRMPHAALASIHADPDQPMPVHEDTAVLRELPAEAVDALLAVAGPGSGSPQVIVELRRLGGAAARTTAPASAYCHRDAAYALLTIGVLAPEIAAIVPGHGREVVAAVEPWSTGLRLPNFGPASGREAYDEHTRTWLAALADRYDPARVLAVGQAVRTAA